MSSIEATPLCKTNEHTELKSPTKQCLQHTTSLHGKNHRRRNSWPKLPELSRKGNLDNGQIDKVYLKEKGCPMCKMDNKIGKVKKKIKLKNYTRFTRWFPLILAIGTLGLTSYDLYTDGASAQRICTAHCNCEYVSGECGTPTPVDICESGFTNGTAAKFYCQDASNNETECRNKDNWSVPQTCRCYWDKYNPTNAYGSKCNAPLGLCGYMKHNDSLGNAYCSKYGNTSENDCTHIPAWEQPANGRSRPSWSIRHWPWCYRSIILIVAPSILNNLFLLVMLLKDKKYKPYLIAAGLSPITSIHWIIISIGLTLMAIFQFLPFLCLILKIVIVYRYLKENIANDEVLDDLDSLTMKLLLVFTFTEDLPQLYTQSLFFVRAVYGLNDGIMDGISWVAMQGLLTSCISLSINYTKYTKNILNSTNSALILFITAFIASGGRILICCFTPEFAFVEANYSNQSLIPLTTVVIIQLLLLFFRFSLRLFRKLNHHNIHPRSQNVSTPDKTKYQPILNSAHILGALVRNLVVFARTVAFRVIIDGCTVAGLWSSACFASWAMWIKLSATYSRGQYSTDSVNMVEVTTAALTFAMLSYSMNIIMVLQNDQDKVEGVLVSVLFVIFPITLFWLYPDINGATNAILIPIVTVAGLAILANIISIMLGRKKTEKKDCENHRVFSLLELEDKVFLNEIYH